MSNESIPPVVRPSNPPRVALADIASCAQTSADASDAATVVTGIALSTGSVQPGDLFVALPGKNGHGAQFAAQAVQAGAVAVLTDAAGEEAASATGVPVLISDRLRERLGELSAFIYGTADNAPIIFGITGTNGKTTTAYVLEAVLRQMGLVTGLSTTAERHIAGEVFVSRLTTPEATDVHALLARMKEQKVEAVVLEVSAQGLTHGRVDGIVFDCAGFTNLSIDHLDDYGTMENYFAAKELLFRPERARTAVVSLETSWGARLLAEPTIPVASISADATADPDWRLEILDALPEATRFRVTNRAGATVETTVALLGDHLVADAGLAVAMIIDAGYAADRVQAALQDGIEVYIPGRTESVSGPTGPRVYVDFGHSSDAFEKTLRAVKAVTAGRVIMLFGADGDRDPVKRPEMARVAAAGSDIVVVTDHHPRFEDPASIRRMLVEAAREAYPGKQIVEVTPPEAAIDYAVDLARDGDAILWAGPGHQDYRDIRGVRTPYSARALAREALTRHGWPV
ncbi:UDP-N-acetylmuramoyl-L-alanyl-D-glutamate--2,6-diaminopimelate ligase [Cryobacterium sp. SO2]|uniref:Mur ligase family protein n=1 Tax=Cryobacterium sp. SO2 TaxID=1897060 RepID=UPI00223CA75E|nr:UDP-N-acetylmuramoyl-L-alanyl-D-glutamate--2,6-diaminopimelate ligase [Cryobacterium sp. SO2]WEO77542.1 UDP-N-acetylmuramoyl-L-alanyl-D-glutamate--2,6-diaminopimelate ligase [Cryobacterium sp. SO2]